MFLASKFLSFATQPLAWALVFLLGGLVGISAQRRWGIGLCWSALCLLLLTGWSLPVDSLLRQLESQHPATVVGTNLQKYVGVVVLGGALEPGYVWLAHDQMALTDAAERMIVPLALVQRYPHLHVLFTGGEGELISTGPTEAQRAKVFFDSMGIAPQRVVYESASRTTHENAVLSATATGVNPAASWLLLTSAYHMPRAMATFRKAGWNVTPYPVDFHTGADTKWTSYSLTRNPRKWHLALHELAGLVAYRLTGRA